MSNIQSYNALIDRFHAFASGHFILKRFSHGQIEVSDLEKFGEYPFMHVVPSNVTYAKGMKTFSFQIVLADLPRDKEDKPEYQREVLSDLQRIAEDLVAEITNHRMLFGDLITVQNVSLEPFLEEFQHTLTGWTISLDLLVPYYWDACSIPAEWNDFFESGSGGTGSILTFIDSINRDENGNVSLVNDEETPAPNYYYGTNNEGVRGWYLLSDEVGLTCETIGDCQTIIDIEAAIDLLQQDVTDLQGDVSSLETNKVPYTGATQDVDLGEFELKAGQVEFDQTPTGTAGVGVMRWNDSDGTLDLGLKGGNVTLQVGQESVLRVVNKTATNVNLLEANYQAVRVTGAQGQRLKVDLALATTDLLSAETIGLVTETINNNQEGFITTSGLVRGINTTGSLQGETWADGDILYLSPTTAGNATKVKPVAPNHLIILGYVIHAHITQGSIFVKVDNGYELDELHNVKITTPANNNVLAYTSATDIWENKTVATALGYTPVPETRNLTINGTTQDLSADRTFTIATGLTVGTTPITSGTVGRVLFEGTGNVLQEDAGLNWDNTNKRLSLVSTGDNLLNLTPQASGNAIVFNNNSFIKWGTVSYIRGFSTSTLFSVLNSSFTNVFNIGTSSACYVNTGSNFLIGTTTDAGYKLDVNGTSRFTGLLINTAYSTSVQRLQFNNGNPALNIGYIRGVSDGIIRLLTAAEDTFTRLQFGGGTTAFPALQRSGAALCVVDGTGTGLANLLIGTTTDAGYKLDVNGTARIVSNLTIGQGAYMYSQGYNNLFFPFQYGQSSIYYAGGTSLNNGTPSGTKGTFYDAISFVPVGGTATFSSFLSAPVINQTGGANGITRGLYIAPTLTSAFDFRAIETTTGKVIFNGGNVLIGTSTDSGFKLDVNGTARIGGSSATALIVERFSMNSNILIEYKNATTSWYAGHSSLNTFSIGKSSNLATETIFNIRSNGNILIGTNTDVASSRLTVESTTQGFLPPRMTTTQKNAIASPVAGLVVYDSTTNKLCCYNGTTWNDLF